MKKIASWFTLICFLWSHLFLGLPNAYSGLAPVNFTVPGETSETASFFSDDLKLSPVLDAALPSELGSIVERYRGKGDFLLVYIQDAHANYSIQENIAKILHAFSENGVIATAYLEGVFGQVETGLVKAASSVASAEGCRRLLEEARISGADYFQAVSRRGEQVDLRGIEEKGIYFENARAFMRMMDLKVSTEKEMKTFRTYVDNLKHRYYSAELKKLDRLHSKFETREADLSYYLKNLKKMSAAPDPLVKYPNLQIVDKLLTENLSKTQMELQMSFLDRNSFFMELEHFTAGVYQGYLRNETQKAVYQLIKDIRLLSRGFDLELMPEEAGYLRDNISALERGALMDRISRLDGKKRWHTSSRWDKAVRNMIIFYDWVEKRDHSLSGNLLMHLSEENPAGAAFLITGGFHRSGLTRELRKKGISYLVIAPAMDSAGIEQGRGLYRDRFREWMSANKLSLMDAYDLEAPFEARAKLAADNLKTQLGPAGNDDAIRRVARVYADQTRGARDYAARMNFLEEVLSRLKIRMDLSVLPAAASLGAPEADKVFWSGKEMIFNPQTNLYDLRDTGEVEKLGAYGKYAPGEALRQYPDALITGAALNVTGSLNLGGQHWFSIKAHARAQDVIVQLAGGEPAQLYRPHRDDAGQVLGYEMIYSAENQYQFWKGKTMTPDAGTGLYQLTDEENVERLGTFINVSPETLEVFPNAAVTGVRLDKMGILVFGNKREDRKKNKLYWLRLPEHGGAEGLVMILEKGKPRRLFKPVYGKGTAQGDGGAVLEATQSLLGYKEIYPGKVNVFWQGRSMEFGQASGLYQLKDSESAEFLGAFPSRIWKKTLEEFPDALVTGIDLGRDGHVRISRVGKPWFVLYKHRGVTDAVIQLKAGKPERVFKPLYRDEAAGKVLTGYELIYQAGVKNVFWQGKTMVDEEGQGLFRIREMPDAEVLGEFSRIKEKTLKQFPNALVTGFSLDRKGNLKFGRKKNVRWDAYPDTKGETDLVLELKNGEPAQLFAPQYDDKKVLTGYRLILPSSRNTFWSGKRMKLDQKTGLYVAEDFGEGKRLGAFMLLRKEHLQDYPDALVTNVHIDRWGHFHFAKEKGLVVFSDKANAGAKDVIVQLKEGKVYQAFRNGKLIWENPEFKQAEAEMMKAVSWAGLPGVSAQSLGKKAETDMQTVSWTDMPGVNPGKDSPGGKVMWLGRRMELDAGSGLYKIAGEGVKAAVYVKDIPAQALAEHPEALVTGMRINAKGSFHLGARQWFKLTARTGEEGLVAVISGGEVQEVYAPKYGEDDEILGYERIYAQEEQKVVWAGKQMEWDEGSGLYRIMEGKESRKVGTYSVVISEILEKNPDVLITGLNLDVRGALALAGRLRFQLAAYKEAQNVAVVIKGGEVKEAYVPRYDAARRIIGYEQIYVAEEQKIVWEGKFMRQVEAGGLYQIAEGKEARQIGIYRDFPSRVLIEHPNVLITGLVLDSSGSLALGQKGQFRLTAHAGAEDVVAVVQGGELKEAYAPKRGAQDEILGYERIYAEEDQRVIWAGKRMEWDEATGLYRLVDSEKVDKLGVYTNLPAQALRDHPDSLVTGVNGGVNGALDLGGKTWSQISSLKGAEGLVVVIREGEVKEVYGPKHGDLGEILGYERLDAEEDKKTVWAGRRMEWDQGKELYQIVDGENMRKVGLYRDVPAQIVKDNPDVLVTGVNTGSTGGIGFGSKTAVALLSLQNRQGLAVVIKAGEVAEIYAPQYLAGSKEVLGYTRMYAEEDSRRGVWTGKKMVWNPGKGFYELTETADVRKVTASMKIPPGALKDNPDALITGVNLNGIGGLTLGGQPWFTSSPHKRAQGVIVQLRGGKVHQAFHEGKLIWENPEFTEFPDEAMKSAAWNELPGAAVEANSLGVRAFYIDFDQLLLSTMGYVGSEEWMQRRSETINESLLAEEMRRHEDRMLRLGFYRMKGNEDWTYEGLEKDSEYVENLRNYLRREMANLEQLKIRQNMVLVTRRPESDLARVRALMKVLKIDFIDHVLHVSSDPAEQYQSILNDIRLRERDEKGKKLNAQDDVLILKADSRDVLDNKSRNALRREFRLEAGNRLGQIIYRQPLPAPAAEYSAGRSLRQMERVFKALDSEKDVSRIKMLLEHLAEYTLDAVELAERESRYHRIEIYRKARDVIRYVKEQKDAYSLEIDISHLELSFLREAGSFLYELQKDLARKQKSPPEIEQLVLDYFSLVTPNPQTFARYFFEGRVELQYTPRFETNTGQSFNIPVTRNNIYAFLEPLLQYILKEKPDRIILVDTGARPLQHALRIFLKRYAPQTTLHFLPVSTKSAGDTTLQLKKILQDAKHYTADPGFRDKITGAYKEVVEEFQAIFPLAGKKLFLIDDNIVSGSTMKMTADALRRFGVDRLSIGSIVTFNTERSEPDKPSASEWATVATFQIPGDYVWRERRPYVVSLPEWEPDSKKHLIGIQKRNLGQPLERPLKVPGQIREYEEFKREMEESFEEDLKAFEENLAESNDQEFKDPILAFDASQYLERLKEKSDVFNTWIQSLQTDPAVFEAVKQVITQVYQLGFELEAFLIEVLIPATQSLEAPQRTHVMSQAAYLLDYDTRPSLEILQRMLAADGAAEVRAKLEKLFLERSVDWDLENSPADRTLYYSYWNIQMPYPAFQAMLEKYRADGFSETAVKNKHQHKGGRFAADSALAVEGYDGEIKTVAMRPTYALADGLKHYFAGKDHANFPMTHPDSMLFHFEYEGAWMGDLHLVAARDDGGNKILIFDYLVTGSRLPADSEVFLAAVTRMVETMAQEENFHAVLISSSPYRFTPQFENRNAYNQLLARYPVFTRREVDLESVYDLRHKDLSPEEIGGILEGLQKEAEEGLLSEQVRQKIAKEKNRFERAKKAQKPFQPDAEVLRLLNHRFRSTHKGTRETRGYKVLWKRLDPQRQKEIADDLKKIDSFEAVVFDDYEKSILADMRLVVALDEPMTENTARFRRRFEQRLELEKIRPENLTAWQKEFLTGPGKPQDKKVAGWTREEKLRYQALEVYFERAEIRSRGERVFPLPYAFFQGEEGAVRAAELIRQIVLRDYREGRPALRNLKKLRLQDFQRKSMTKLWKDFIGDDLYAAAEIAYPGQYVREVGNGIRPAELELSDVRDWLAEKKVLVEARQMLLPVKSFQDQGAYLEYHFDRPGKQPLVIRFAKEELKGVSHLVLRVYEDPNQGFGIGIFRVEDFAEAETPGEVKPIAFIPEYDRGKDTILSLNVIEKDVLDVLKGRQDISISGRHQVRGVMVRQDGRWAARFTLLAGTAYEARMDFDIGQESGGKISEGEKVVARLERDANQGILFRIYKESEFSDYRSENELAEISYRDHRAILAAYRYFQGNEKPLRRVSSADLAAMDLMDIASGRDSVRQDGGLVRVPVTVLADGRLKFDLHRPQENGVQEREEFIFALPDDQKAAVTAAGFVWAASYKDVNQGMVVAVTDEARARQGNFSEPFAVYRYYRGDKGNAKFQIRIPELNVIEVYRGLILKPGDQVKVRVTRGMVDDAGNLVIKLFIPGLEQDKKEALFTIYPEEIQFDELFGKELVFKTLKDPNLGLHVSVIAQDGRVIVSELGVGVGKGSNITKHVNLPFVKLLKFTNHEKDIHGLEIIPADVELNLRNFTVEAKGGALKMEKYGYPLTIRGVPPDHRPRQVILHPVFLDSEKKWVFYVYDRAFYEKYVREHNVTPPRDKGLLPYPLMRHPEKNELVIYRATKRYQITERDESDFTYMLERFRLGGLMRQINRSDRKKLVRVIARDRFDLEACSVLTDSILGKYDEEGEETEGGDGGTDPPDGGGEDVLPGIDIVIPREGREADIQYVLSGIIFKMLYHRLVQSEESYQKVLKELEEASQNPNVDEIVRGIYAEWRILFDRQENFQTAVPEIGTPPGLAGLPRSISFFQKVAALKMMELMDVKVKMTDTDNLASLPLLTTHLHQIEINKRIYLVRYDAARGVFILTLREDPSKEYEVPASAEGQHVVIEDRAYYLQPMSKGILLASEPGLGKTLQAIAAILGLKDPYGVPKIKQALIISPKSARYDAWVRQADEWLKEKHQVAVIEDRQGQRVSVFRLNEQGEPIRLRMSLEELERDPAWRQDGRTKFILTHYEAVRVELARTLAIFREMNPRRFENEDEIEALYAPYNAGQAKEDTVIDNLLQLLTGLEEFQRLGKETQEQKRRALVSAARSSFGLLERLKKLQPELTVIDEAHNLSNEEAQRTQDIFQIDSEYKMLLTATPLLSRDITKMYPMLHWLYPEEFPSLDQFTRDYPIRPLRPNPEQSAEIAAENVQIERENAESRWRLSLVLLRFMVRHRKRDVLDDTVNKIMRRPVEVRLHDDESQLYNRKRYDFRNFLQELGRDPQDIPIHILFSKLSSLRQAANGFDAERARSEPDYLENWYNVYTSKDEVLDRLIVDKLESFRLYDVTKKEWIVVPASAVEIELAGKKYTKYFNRALGHAVMTNRETGVSFIVSPKEESVVIDGISYKIDFDKMVVFSYYRSVVEKIKRRYAAIYGVSSISGDVSSSTTRQKEIDRFQEKGADDRGKTRLFVATKSTGSESLTLIKANHMVIYDSDWLPLDQTFDRIHRLGQEKDAYYYFLAAVTAEGLNTIDWDVFEIHKQKKNVYRQSIDGEFELTDLDAAEAGDEGGIDTGRLSWVDQGGEMGKHERQREELSAWLESLSSRAVRHETPEEIAAKNLEKKDREHVRQWLRDWIAKAGDLKALMLDIDDTTARRGEPLSEKMQALLHKIRSYSVQLIFNTGISTKQIEERVLPGISDPLFYSREGTSSFRYIDGKKETIYFYSDIPRVMRRYFEEVMGKAVENSGTSLDFTVSGSLFSRHRLKFLFKSVEEIKDLRPVAEEAAALFAAGAGEFKGRLENDWLEFTEALEGMDRAAIEVKTTEARTAAQNDREKVTERSARDYLGTPQGLEFVEFVRTSLGMMERLYDSVHDLAEHLLTDERKRNPADMLKEEIDRISDLIRLYDEGLLDFKIQPILYYEKKNGDPLGTPAIHLSPFDKGFAARDFLKRNPEIHPSQILGIDDEARPFGNGLPFFAALEPALKFAVGLEGAPHGLPNTFALNTKNIHAAEIILEELGNLLEEKFGVTAQSLGASLTAAPGFSAALAGPALALGQSLAAKSLGDGEVEVWAGRNMRFNPDMNLYEIEDLPGRVFLGRHSKTPFSLINTLPSALVFGLKTYADGRLGFGSPGVKGKITLRGAKNQQGLVAFLEAGRVQRLFKPVYGKRTIQGGGEAALEETLSIQGDGGAALEAAEPLLGYVEVYPGEENAFWSGRVMEFNPGTGFFEMKNSGEAQKLKAGIVRKTDLEAYPGALITGVSLDVNGILNIGGKSALTLSHYPAAKNLVVTLKNGKPAQIFRPRFEKPASEQEYEIIGRKIVGYERIYKAEEIVFWTGKTVKFNPAKRFYEIETSEDAAILGEYQSPHVKLLKLHPDALVTGVSTNSNGNLSFGAGGKKGKGINMRSHRGSENLIAVVRDGLPREVYKPVYQKGQVAGYELIFPYQENVFWEGRRIRLNEASGLYDFEDSEESNRAGSFPLVTPELLAKYPQAVVTGVTLPKNGALKFGQQEQKYWFIVRDHGGEEDLVLILQDGVPFQLYRPVYDTSAGEKVGEAALEETKSLLGYEEIYPGENKVFWEGKAMVLNTATKLYDFTDLAEVRRLEVYGARGGVPKEALTKYPDALVTNVNLSAGGALKLGHEKDRTWLTLPQHKGASGLVAVLRDGEPAQLFKPVYGKKTIQGASLEETSSLLGYEEIYHLEQRVFWSGKTMVLNTATGAYEMQTTVNAKPLLKVKYAEPTHLANYPDALVTGVHLGSTGSLIFGKPGGGTWFTRKAYANAEDVILQLQSGKVYQAFYQGKLIWENPELGAAAAEDSEVQTVSWDDMPGVSGQSLGEEKVFWEGRRLELNAETGLYEMREDNPRKVAAYSQVPEAALTRYPNALVTGVRLNVNGGLSFGRKGSWPWFNLFFYKSARDLVLVLADGKPERLYKPEYNVEGKLRGYQEIYPGEENAFWEGKRMELNEQTGLYELKGGNARKLAAHRHVLPDTLTRYPDALVTGVRLNSRGGLSFGREGGRAWFSLLSYKNARDLVLILEDGKPVNLYKPEYDVEGKLRGYQEIYSGEDNVFWEGKRLELNEQTGLYELKGGNARKLAAHRHVLPDTLTRYPDALVTGVRLNSRGGLSFGREGGRAWFSLFSYKNARDLVLILEDGKPVNLYKPEYDAEGKLRGYQEIYPGEDNVFWEGKHMELSAKAGLYEMRGGNPLKLAAYRYVAPDALTRYPNALVTGVSLDSKGGLSFGREGAVPWFYLAAYKGAQGFVLQLREGKVYQAFHEGKLIWENPELGAVTAEDSEMLPASWKDLPGVSGQSLGSKKEVWLGKRMELDAGSGLYKLVDGTAVAKVGAYVRVPLQALQDHPDALITGVNLDSKGSLKLGRRKPWFQVRQYKNAEDLVVVLKGSELKEVYKPEYGEGGELRGYKQIYSGEKNTFWSGRHMELDAGSGLYKLVDGAAVAKVGAYRQVPARALQDHPDALITGVNLNSQGKLSLGRRKPWFQVRQYKNAEDLVVVLKGNELKEVYKPEYGDGGGLKGYEQIYPGERNAFWSGRHMELDAGSGLYKLVDGAAVAKVRVYVRVPLQALQDHPDALITGVNLDSKGLLTLGRSKPWFQVNQYKNAEDLVVVLKGGEPKEAYRPEYGEGGELRGYEQIYPGKKNAFWSGRHMELDAGSGLYKLMDGAAVAKVGAYLQVPARALQDHPDALITGVSLTPSGGLHIGGEPWFRLSRYKNAENLIVQLRDGKVFQAFHEGKLIWDNPEFKAAAADEAMRTADWTEMPGVSGQSLGSKKEIWLGKRMELDAGSGLYRMADGEQTEKAGGFSSVPASALQRYPESLILGVHLGAEGQLALGGKLWFASIRYKNAKDLIAMVKGGQPVELYKPEYAEGGRLKGYSQIYSKEKNVFWRGQRMELDHDSGLYQLAAEAGAGKIGAYERVPPDALRAHPEALISGVNLNKYGRLKLGSKVWATLSKYKNAADLWVVLKDGEPIQVFKPVYGKAAAEALLGYEQIYFREENEFWLGRHMELDKGSGLYKVAAGADSKRIGTYRIVPPRVLQLYPNALISGASLDRYGRLKLGGKAWFTLARYRKTMLTGLFIQLRDGKVYQAFHGGKLIWENPEFKAVAADGAMRTADWNELPGVSGQSLGRVEEAAHTAYENAFKGKGRKGRDDYSEQEVLEFLQTLLRVYRTGDDIQSTDFARRIIRALHDQSSTLNLKYESAIQLFMLRIETRLKIQDLITRMKQDTSRKKPLPTKIMEHLMDQVVAGHAPPVDRDILRKIYRQFYVIGKEYKAPDIPSLVERTELTEEQVAAALEYLKRRLADLGYRGLDSLVHVDTGEKVFWQGKVMIKTAKPDHYELQDSGTPQALVRVVQVTPAHFQAHPQALVTGVSFTAQGAFNFGQEFRKSLFSRKALKNAKDAVVQLKDGQVYQVFHAGVLIWTNPDLAAPDEGLRQADWKDLPGSDITAQSLGVHASDRFSITVINEKYLTRPGMVDFLIRHLNAHPGKVVAVVWHNDHLTAEVKKKMEERARGEIKINPERFLMMDVSDQIDLETALNRALSSKFLDKMLQLARRLEPAVKNQTDLMKYIGVLENREILANMLQQNIKVAEIEEKLLPSLNPKQRDFAEQLMIISTGELAALGGQFAELQKTLPDIFQQQGGVFEFTNSLIGRLKELLELHEARETLEKAA